MAEKDNGSEDGVNLEMPSLGFGSKRRKRKTGKSDEQPTAEATSADSFVPPPAPTSPSSFRPPGEPADDRPLYADEAADTAVLPPTEEAQPAKAAKAPKSPKPAKKPKEPLPWKVPKTPREKPLIPEVPGMTVAVLTGILIGLLACGATYLGLQGCESIRGTSSCGGPGFLLLVTIMIALVLIGAFVMKAFRVTDPGSTAFLAVGLLAVIVLLFLVDVIFEWYMIIVIPLVGAGTFALSHWVTTTFIEPADNQPSA
jgi:hypothetical protein